MIDLCNKYKKDLTSSGVSCYIDLSEKTPGFKFAEAEVNGIPVRLEIGKRDLENNQITIARRDTREKSSLDISCDIVKEVKDLMDDIQNNLYKRAEKRRDEMTFRAENLKELEEIMNRQPGFVHGLWCGREECELKVKEINHVVFLLARNM